jgi:hypothetical protein
MTFVRFPIDSGIVPVIPLFERRRKISEDMLKMVRKLSGPAATVVLVRSRMPSLMDAKPGGRGPVIAVNAAVKYSNLRKLTIESGTEPLMSVSGSHSSLSCVQLPMSLGMEPSIFEFDRSRRIKLVGATPEGMAAKRAE